MQKNRKIKVMLPDDSSGQTPEEENLSQKAQFDLYLKEKEIQEISQILQSLSAKRDDERRQWLRDNEDLMVDLAERFVDESLYKIDGIQMDNQTLELSVQVMSKLRKTLGLFQTIINDDDELEA